MSVSSDEINFLVYRYLLESGFTHSAFTFSLESHVHQSSINGSSIPPGALISVLQKGLQYIEAEASISEVQDGTILEERVGLSLVDAVAQSSSNSLVNRSSQTSVESSGIEPGRPGGGGDEHTSTLVDPSRVTVLRGHSSEVFTCAWSPVANIIVSGSGDSTARLWHLHDDGSHEPPMVLPHEPVGAVTQECNRDVTTVHWNEEGNLLATGSYDGVARLWTPEGTLKASLTHHSGPIFALKWNPRGSYIATGGVDKTAIVWEVASGEVRQQFSFHRAATLDVDWQNNTTFASCSTDKLIHVCRVGSDRPIRTLQGHKSGVNAVRWDPSGSLLASCSDDHTAKVWSLKQDSWLHDLKEHSGDIYTLQWSPSPSPLLATASFDSTIRLWEMERGSCLHTLRKHMDPVYSVAFSPDGRLLASGSFDKYVYVWSTADGSLVRQYKSSSGIFEVCWSRNGGKLAACFSNNTVCVLDLRGL